MTYNGFMNCIRCGKKIPHPNDSKNTPSSADYIIASDTIVKEREQYSVTVPKTELEIAEEKESLGQELAVFRAVAQAYEKRGIEPKGISIDDVYGEINAIEDILLQGINPTKQEPREGRLKDIQKTGIICPECYKKTDKVIWGVHKK